MANSIRQTYKMLPEPKLKKIKYRGVLKILIFESPYKIKVSFRLLFVLNKMLPLNNL